MKTISVGTAALVPAMLITFAANSATSGTWQNRPNVDEGRVFQNNRPSSSGKSKPRARPAYHMVTARTTEGTGVAAEVGVTIFQETEGMRLLQQKSGGGELLHEKAQPGGAPTTGAAKKEMPKGPGGDSVEEHVWKRVESTAQLSGGDRLRLTVEAPVPGFLYVIDREKFVDGSVGDPLLIFPTNRINGGDNKVAPGRLVEIPSRDDKPPYFTFVTSRKGATHIGDVITLIVAPEPMAGLPPLESNPIRLAPDQFSTWEKKWGGQTERYEMAGGAGQLWTKEEQSAGVNGGPSLTENSPLPQTIYRVWKKPGEPILITVPLVLSKTPSHS